MGLPASVSLSLSHSKLDLHGNQLLVTTFQLPSGLDFSTFSLKIDDTVECLSVTPCQLAIMTQNKVYYEYNSSGIVSQPSSAEDAVVKTCDAEGTVSSIATECVMTIMSHAPAVVHLSVPLESMERVSRPQLSTADYGGDECGDALQSGGIQWRVEGELQEVGCRHCTSRKFPG